MPRPIPLSGPAAAWSAAGLALLVAVAAPVAAREPRAVHASAAPREAQFVFVVDDSGSMKKTDPNRLAVFAVRSLLGMLDDRDEVSVVRLNGPFEGETSPPIEPLAENRGRMLDRLDLEHGAIARYGASKTPCTVALRAVRDLLAASYRSSAAQVVFFLTDGECDPADFRDAEALSFLDGLPAHEAGMLQLHLLRFQGEDVSTALERLAGETGGGVHEIAAGDPTAILHAFAAALSRSQGYEAHLLGPGDDRLPAHRGAERVRLLAVAPGEGEPLRFALRDARGRPPEVLDRTRTGTHRFGDDGEPFRFAALDYRPPTAGDTGPVTVEVSGAGAAWRVVAVPEYRLALSLALFRGTCDDPGERLRHAVERGAPVCVVAELRNGAGEVVTGAVTAGEMAASVTVRRPDRPGDEPRVFPGNPAGGDAARFLVQRSGLEPGAYAFTPEVELGLSSGGAVALRGPTLALEVTAVEIDPNPSSLDFGPVVPGERPSQDLSFTGSFPDTQGHLEWVDRAAVPGCVTAELNEKSEGESQSILPGHEYRLALRIAPYCGPVDLDRRFETGVRLVFDHGRLPSTEVKVAFRLVSEIDAPDELAVEVPAGEAVRVPVSITGSFRGELRFRATVEPAPDGWPEDEGDLAIGAGGGEVVLASGAGAAVPIEARAHRCCPGGSYRATLLFAPPTGAYPAGAEPPAPLAVPIVVRVLPGGFWTCWGPWIVRLLAGLLLLLALLYLVGMYRNSRFLDPRQVADRLRPLVWTSFGGTEERRGVQDEVRRMVARGLPWLGRSGRIAAWLRANPLRFGLPGGRYEETLELRLVPSHDTAASAARLLAEPAFLEGLRTSPKEYWGRLFATARAGVTLVGVPDTGGLISRLAPEGVAEAPGGGSDPESAPRPVTLRNTPLVRPLDPRERPEEGAAAGWRVG